MKKRSYQEIAAALEVAERRAMLLEWQISDCQGAPVARESWREKHDGINEVKDGFRYSMTLWRPFAACGGYVVVRGRKSGQSDYLNLDYLDNLLRWAASAAPTPFNQDYRIAIERMAAARRKAYQG